MEFDIWHLASVVVTRIHTRGCCLGKHRRFAGTSGRRWPVLVPAPWVMEEYGQRGGRFMWLADGKGMEMRDTLRDGRAGADCEGL